MKKTVVIDGGKIVDLIAELDSTQDELAAFSGVDVRTIRRLQKPDTPCRRATLEKLIKGFNKIARDRFGGKARKWTIDDFLAERSPSDQSKTSKSTGQEATTPQVPHSSESAVPASGGDVPTRKSDSTKPRARKTVLALCAVALLVGALAVIRRSSDDQPAPGAGPAEVALNGRLDEANKRMRQGFEFLGWTEVQEALRAFEKAYNIRHEWLGEDAKETLEAQRQIAVARHWLADFEQAEQIQWEVLEKLEGREEQALTYGVMSDLARTLSAQGQATENLQWVAKDRLLSLEGKQGADSLIARHNALLGAFYLKSDAIEAELKDLLADMKARHGDRHPHTIGSLMNLGVFYTIAGDAQHATASLTEAKDLAEQHLGPDNTWTVLILVNLAVARQGSHEELRSLADPLRESFERVHTRMPADHPTMLDIGQRVAAVCSMTGQNEQGINVMSDVVDGTERRFGPDNALTWKRRHWLAIHYKQAQRVKEAIPILEQVRDYHQQRQNDELVSKISLDLVSCKALGAFDFLGVGSQRRRAMNSVGTSVLAEFSRLLGENRTNTKGSEPKPSFELR